MNDQTIKSCLFLDFDNIYLGLQNQSTLAALTFAQEPRKWLEWLENEEGTQDSIKRRILVRKCYINPTTFAEFRPYFVKSSFQVVDCPSLTKQGKNSADIYMVLDVLKYLEHDVYYDEFIIMSADSDFTPIVVRLREYARSTFVVTAGMSSPAYSNSADRLMTQSGFIEILENFNKYKPKSFPFPFDSEPADASFKPILAEDIEREIYQLLAENGNEMLPVQLSQRLKTQLPGLFSNHKWYGYNKFSTFLKSLSLKNVEMDLSVPGNIRLMDDSKSAGDSVEDDFLKKVHSICNIPVLSRETYVCFFEELYDYLMENEYSFTACSLAMRDRMKEKDHSIPRYTSNFILIGLNHYNLNRCRDQLTQEGMQEAYVTNLMDLIDSALIRYSEEELGEVRNMIGLESK